MQRNSSQISRLLQVPVRLLKDTSRSPFEGTLIHRYLSYRIFEGVLNKKGIPFAIEVGVELSTAVDAVSALESRTHWVVISDGLVGALDKVFSMLAATSNSETFFSPGHVFESTDPPPNRSARGDLDRATPENALTAGYMAHIALRFVADHEFFHAFHGHLLLLEELQERAVLTQAFGGPINYGRDIRLALELEADRSAATQQVIDFFSGSLPTNDAIAKLSLDERISLIFVSIAAVMALLATEEEASGLSTGDTHPRWACRLYMLLGPTLVRALRLANLDSATASNIHTKVLGRVLALSAAHAVFGTIETTLRNDRMEVYDIESRRLEVVYRLTIAPLLVKHQFSGQPDSDPKIYSVR